MKRLTMAVAVALLLAGCGTETASFLVSGGDVALTLERTKAYPWTSAWDAQMVVRNDPECQRRHTLKDIGDGAFKVEVFFAGPGVFILRQNKRWYVTSLKTCDLQQYKEPPAEPGTSIGAFQEKNGSLVFVLDKAAAEEALPAAPAAVEKGG